MHNFLLPQFMPRSLEELPTEPDEVSSLVYMEDAIAKELGAIRDYNKHKVPLGKLPETEEQSEAGDNDGAATPESEMMSDIDDAMDGADDFDDEGSAEEV